MRVLQKSLILSTFLTSVNFGVHVCSEQPVNVYSVFKRLGSELVLGLFLNVHAEEQPELFQEVVELCTQHWHGEEELPYARTHAHTRK